MKFGVALENMLTAENAEAMAKSLTDAGLNVSSIENTPIVDTRTGEEVARMTLALCESSWVQYVLFKAVNKLTETVCKADGFRLLSK